MSISTIVIITLYTTVNINGAPVLVCKEPDSMTAKFQKLNADVNMTEFLSPVKSAKKNKSRPSSVKSTIRGTSECPTSLPDIGDISSRSMCPWRYDIDHDVTRFPASIPRAVRKCQTCVGLNSSQHVCELISQTITVFRQDGTEANGSCKYRQISESIPIAFVCAHRREVYSGPNTLEDPGLISM